MTQHTVVGMFDTAADAQQAVDQLISNGFTKGQIDLSAARSSATGGSDELFPDRHTNTSGTRTEELIDDTKDVSSGVGSFFSNLFGDDEENNRKYARVASQHSVVTVHTQTEEEAERAADLLDDAGAINVDERAAGYDSLTTAPSASMGAAFTDVSTTPSTVDTTGNPRIEVIEENLAVGKRTVETGGVRLHSRVVAKPVEESIRLREERVVVKRTAVNRPVTATDLTAFQEGQIELTEHAEVPVVAKTATVVEEISVNKAVTEREEVIHDTLRKTEVDVQNLGTTDQATRTTSTDLDTDDDVTYATK